MFLTGKLEFLTQLKICNCEMNLTDGKFYQIYIKQFCQLKLSENVNGIELAGTYFEIQTVMKLLLIRKLLEIFSYHSLESIFMRIITRIYSSIAM